MRVFLLLIIIGLLTTGAHSGDIRKIKTSIVLIDAQYVDTNNGNVKLAVGSGFFVSPNGLVLTAKHVIDGWVHQTQRNKQKFPLRATIGGKYSGQSVYLDVLAMGSGIASELALLEVKGANPDTRYSYINLCLERADDVESEEFYAIGFPVADDIQEIPGVIGRRTGPGNIHRASSDFTYGMSGGPVLKKASGRNVASIIGVIQGGKKNQSAIRFVIPIDPIRRFDRDLLQHLKYCNPPTELRTETTAGDPGDSIWDFARDLNTKGSLQRFIESFPNNKQIPEARRLLAALVAAGSRAREPGQHSVGESFWRFGEGKPKHIPICLENPDPEYKNEILWVRNALEASWERFSPVKFVGWRRCKSEEQAVRIFIGNGIPHAKAIGPMLLGIARGIVLNFPVEDWSPTCANMRETCIRSTAVHEFGHVLGFRHEHARPDTPGECSIKFGTFGYDPEVTPIVLMTPYDPESVMNYCNEVWLNLGALSRFDREKLKIVYGSAN